MVDGLEANRQVCVDHVTRVFMSWTLGQGNGDNPAEGPLLCESADPRENTLCGTIHPQVLIGHPSRFAPAPKGRRHPWGGQAEDRDPLRSRI